MDKQIKQKWIKALKSDEFKQGKDELVQYDSLTGKFKYCCLGVLGCIITKKSKEQYSLERAYGHDSNVFLRKDLAKRAGINKATQITLANLNDIENKSFSEIADYIKVNL